MMLGGMLLLLNGCVSTGRFEAKEREAQGLGKSLQELQGEYQKQGADNERLKGEVQKMAEKNAALTAERDALSTSNKGLADSLKSTSDSKNRKIAELDEQNRKLKEDVVRLQQQKETEVQKTSKTYEELLEKMKSEISKGEVTISELKGKLTVNVVEAVLFDSGKAEVKPNGLVVLQKVVDILKNLKDKAIRVEGHTDNVPIVGALARKYPTNWELSAARAINVTRYLEQQGIDPALLGAVAYGEYKPVASNDTDEGRAKNRRIEIVLVAKE